MQSIMFDVTNTCYVMTYLVLSCILQACYEPGLTTAEVTAYAMPIRCYSDALRSPQRTLEGYVTSTLAPNLSSIGWTMFVDHAGTYIRERDGRRCVMGFLYD